MTIQNNKKISKPPADRHLSESKQKLILWDKVGGGFAQLPCFYMQDRELMYAEQYRPGHNLVAIQRFVKILCVRLVAVGIGGNDIFIF